MPFQKVEFEFPHDYAFTAIDGTSTNLTVHATTGVNLQVRIVPRVEDDLDFKSQGDIHDPELKTNGDLLV